VRLAWPLIGRAEELQLIEESLSVPTRPGVVVCGAAGVGKSRIAREALSVVESRGYVTRWAVGTASARDVPLGAFAPWAGAGVTDTLAAVRGVIEALTASPAPTRVVVGVDDAHLLDDLSVFVVHQIVQRSAAKVVLTVRDGERIPPGLQELWTGAGFETMNLQPLSREEIATLVSGVLGGILDPEATQRLWNLTRGNVLYLRNIVEQEVADGRLALQHECWRWLGDPIVPRSLVELIESRIGGLPAAVAGVVDVLAVGEPIELAALTRITDAAAVEDADMRGLITLDHASGGEEVRLAHPLYGEVRRKQAAATRLRRLRGLVAAELASSARRDEIPMVVRRATLSLESDLKPDPDLLLKAAQGAVWLADMPLADRLAEAAIRSGAPAEARFIRGHALSWLDRGEEADAVVAGLADSELTAADHTRLTVLRASNRLFALADADGAKAFMEASGCQPLTCGCVDVFETIYSFAMGKPAAALKHAKSVVLDELPAVIGVETAWAIASASAHAGRTSDALSTIEAGYEVATRSFDAPQMRFLVVDAHVGALLLSGRIAEAVDVADRLLEQASELPGVAPLLGAAIAGRAALGAGRLEAAQSLLGPVAEALFAAGESNGSAYRYQLPRTIAVALHGSAVDAAAALNALQQRRHPSWRFLDYEWAIAHAWVAASQGAVSPAVKTVRQSAETARADGQFAAEVMCLQVATQLGDRSCAPRLSELEAHVEGPRVGLAARFAAALRDGDGAELASASEDFERMGDHVAAIDAASHAAIEYRRTDRRGSALGCSTRAEEMALRCGASTPALRQASESLPLTDREREIVMLAGGGMSTRSIAERLTLSVRTVEGHIYRAMAKTGTGSREELTAMVSRSQKHQE
jgi:DNA-binding CsgD family transcriptional regulator